MDAFEQVIASILQRQGYWTLINVKVPITKGEKRQIGRHSSPRWELDVVAFRASTNELLIVECKSYLDSHGVDCAAFDATKSDTPSRYKLFCEPKLFKVVAKRLVESFMKQGFLASEPKVRLCLAAGKIRGETSVLEERFAKSGWKLFSPEWIQANLKQLAGDGYENSVAAVVAKILTREKKSRRRRTVADASKITAADPK